MSCLLKWSSVFRTIVFLTLSVLKMIVNFPFFKLDNFVYENSKKWWTGRYLCRTLRNMHIFWMFKTNLLLKSVVFMQRMVAIKLNCGTINIIWFCGTLLLLKVQPLFFGAFNLNWFLLKAFYTLGILRWFVPKKFYYFPLHISCSLSFSF